MISLVVIGLDQMSKMSVFKSLTSYETYAVIPMLNFTLAYNTGSAFSFLSSAGDWHRWFFTIFSAAMSIALMIWIIRLPTKARLQCFALSLILGGALGNLVDRIRLGHVIDFIDVYYKIYHWPVFNLADGAICLGAFLMFLELRKTAEK